MRNKSKTNQDISSVIYGLDEQKKFLKNLLLKFKQTKQGGSCLLSGRRNSGKTLVLETIIQEEFPSDGEVRVVRIDGLQYKRFAATSKLFEQLRLKDMIETQREMDTEERDESSPKKRGKKEQKTKTTEREMEPSASTTESLLLVVDNFEEFAIKQNQNFLYSILNSSQVHPWFVLLIGTTENSVNLLEKRVRSRLSRLKLNFNLHPSLEDFTNCFDHFLELSSVPREIIKQLNQDPSYREHLHDLYARHTGYCYAKKLIMLFEKIVLEKQKTHFNPTKSLHFCMEAILPLDDKQRFLASISVRKLCLLYCLVKLEENMRRVDFTYREIGREYAHFSNNIDKSMRSPDFVLYKDLNELLSAGLISLTNRSDCGQLQFRKVTLNVEQEIMIKSINRIVPSKVKAWLTNR